jgi:sucrose-6-phosphate hydrolase SacC (GH32 family)
MMRPHRHLTAPSGFLNDPTALLQIDGRWHTFFQHSPGAVHGDVSWGHAVSEDLLTWEHLPVAIPSDADEEVWTGSAVVDAHDTAGFGRGALVAAYTSLRRRDLNQSQALASSTDGGLTWTKHGVVLDIGSPDFRDPRLLRHGDHWWMVVARSRDDAIAVYSSPDLRTWTHRSDVPMPRGQGVWECPDLFPLEDRWVLLVSREPETLYVLGDVEDGTFVADGDVRPLDHGPDLYAGVTFTDPPDGRRVLMGWLDSWVYAQALPTEPWRGQLSVGRELSLARDADGTAYLRQRPLAPTTSVSLGDPVEVGPAVRASYDGGEVVIERLDDVVAGFAGRWTVPTGSAQVQVVADTHSLEVFTAEGRSVTLHTLPGPLAHLGDGAPRPSP